MGEFLFAVFIFGHSNLPWIWQADIPHARPSPTECWDHICWNLTDFLLKLRCFNRSKFIGYRMTNRTVSLFWNLNRAIYLYLFYNVWYLYIIINTGCACLTGDVDQSVKLLTLLKLFSTFININKHTNMFVTSYLFCFKFHSKLDVYGISFTCCKQHHTPSPPPLSFSLSLSLSHTHSCTHTCW